MAEVFAWRACELVAGDGVVGLLLPAMTLLMETILRMVERKYGKARRVWVFDRGIVSEENLAAIRKCGGQYLVGTPRSQMKQFEADLSKDDWTRVRPEVEVKKVAIRAGRGNLHSVPHSGPQGKGASHPKPFFQPHGESPAGSAEDHRAGAAEGPP